MLCSFNALFVWPRCVIGIRYPSVLVPVRSSMVESPKTKTRSVAHCTCRTRETLCWPRGGRGLAAIQLFNYFYHSQTKARNCHALSFPAFPATRPPGSASVWKTGGKLLRWHLARHCSFLTKFPKLQIIYRMLIRWHPSCACISHMNLCYGEHWENKH